jgi:hypothetical protein
MTKASSRPLLVGLIMADFELMLIALAGWHALWTEAQANIHSAGGLLCFAGLIIIWIGTTKLEKAAYEQADRVQGTTEHSTKNVKKEDNAW